MEAEKINSVFSKSVKLLQLGFFFEAMVLGLLSVTTTPAEALSFMPEFLWYKTCADSPPGFSPGANFAY